jgi:hypothetical protein
MLFAKPAGALSYFPHEARLAFSTTTSRICSLAPAKDTSYSTCDGDAYLWHMPHT